MKISANPFLFFLFFLNAFIPKTSCQSIEDFEVCLDDIQILNDFSFIDSFDADFNYTKYEEDDFQFIDFIHYYNSDSMKIVFEEYENEINFKSFEIKSKGSKIKINTLNFGQTGNHINDLCSTNSALLKQNTSLCDCNSKDDQVKVLYLDKTLSETKGVPELRLTYFIESCYVAGIALMYKPDY